MTLVPPGEANGALTALPVAALRLPEELLELLAELGIREVGQLAALDRGAVAARLGPLPLRRLDQARGEVDEVIAPYHPAPAAAAQWTFDSPTDRREAVEAALGQLLEQVLAELALRQQGVGRLNCRLERTDGPAWEFSVGLFRASTSPRRLQELVQLQWEARAPASSAQCPAAVAAVAVEVTLALPVASRQQQLAFCRSPGAVDEDQQQRALALLMDRLTSRLGCRRVLRAHLVSDPQPECACRYEPWVHRTETGQGVRLKQRGFKRRAAGGKKAADGDVAAAASHWRRPLRLTPRPVPLCGVVAVQAGAPRRLSWQGQEEQVRRAWGPERIETGWWRGRTARRDYYRVETSRGAWWWIFRRLDDGAWFWQGAFE